MTSRLFVSGVLPGSEHAARHDWLEVDGSVVDMTADPFGEAPVVVGARTAFHESLTSTVADDAADLVASLSAEERTRLERQLAAIESRLPPPGSAAASRTLSRRRYREISPSPARSSSS